MDKSGTSTKTTSAWGVVWGSCVTLAAADLRFTQPQVRHVPNSETVILTVGCACRIGRNTISHVPAFVKAVAQCLVPSERGRLRFVYFADIPIVLTEL